MRCPVCHNSVITFVPTQEICPTLHAHLTIRCPLWQSAEGICHACIDTVELATDETLQSILNGTPDASQDGRIFTYTLSEREEPYWCHTDSTVQNWFRTELRRRVHHLAQGNEHAAWKILNADHLAVDEGDV